MKLRRRPLTKNAARWEIIQRANQYRVGARARRHPWISAQLYGMRQIQQAVCVVRRQKLAGPELLVLAGFHP